MARWAVRITTAFCLLTMAAACLAEVDEVALGKSKGYPAAPNWEQAGNDEFIVWTNSGGQEKFLPYQTIRAGEASPLRKSGEAPRISYEFQGKSASLQDYLDRRRVTSLLILKDGVIQHEHYQYGRNERHRFTSASMGKSVLGLLVGFAIEDGAIASVDDPAVRYLAALKGSVFEKLTIRNLLTMSTGLTWTEGGATGTHYRQMLDAMGKTGGLDVVLGFNHLQPRSAPGTSFFYSSLDSELLGRVLAAALRKSVSAYLEEKLWIPLGAEADAVWFTDRAKVEMTHCCIGAISRDFARLGALLANKGSWNGRQILPARWLEEMTTLHGKHLEKVAIDREPRMGYGYQIWLMRENQIALRGNRGQVIFIDQKNKIVLVQTAVYGPSRNAMTNFAELDALWEGVLASLAGADKSR